MPQFKTTYNILTKQDEDEVFDSAWFESDKQVYPPKRNWDYSRDLQIEDVDIWEVITEASGGLGVYASWSPYAEFYLITTGLDYKNGAKTIADREYYGRTFETFYGPNAAKQAYNAARQIGLNLQTFEYWVEPNEMWLHQDPEPNKIILDLSNNS